MTDITERLREHAAIHEAQVPFDNEQREWADDLRFAAAEIARLRARVAELEAERDDDDALRERMSDILKRTAIALRGPEPPLTAWSWHDLPERAAAAIASIDLFQRVAHNLADPRGLVPMLVDRFLAWKLPEDFAPDGGISFTLISKDHPEWWPTGTCLLNAPQATAMFEYLLGIDGATGEECFTGQLVEIDGHTYGLRPGAARVVREAIADDPELDCTDFAKPAWWRGEAYGSSAAIAAVTRILDGKDDGNGVANEPWQSVRTRLREAMRDAVRYRWLRQPNALERAAHIAVLTHNGGYVATEDRADAAIDAAMAKDGA